MSDLRSHLQEVADQFVASIFNAVRAASLSELTDEPSRAVRNGTPAPRGPGRPAKGPKVVASQRASAGRRKRATSDEVQGQKDAALAAAKQLPPGFSKGDVMKKARSKVNLSRALALLVAEGKLTKKGDRRLTRYWTR